MRMPNYDIVAGVLRPSDEAGSEDSAIRRTLMRWPNLASSA